MKKIIIIVFGICVSILPQRVLTPQEAVQIALQKNVNLQKANTNLGIYNSNLKAAYGDLLPTVNASAGWDWRHTNAPAGSLGGSSRTSIESRDYSLGIGVDYNIYDGGADKVNYDRNQTALNVAGYNVKQIKQDITFQTLSMFYDIINAGKLLDVKEEDVKWNKKNLEIITERNRLGAVTLADVYSQQVKLGNAELALVEAQNAYETLKSSFLYYLGLDVLEKFTFAEPTEMVDYSADSTAFARDFADIQNVVQSALKNRSDYQSAKLSLLYSQQGIDIAKSGFLPKVNSSLGYSLSGTDPIDLFKTRTLSLGLNVTMPLFTGWSIQNRVDLAVIDSKIKELEITDLERDIKRAIHKNYLDLTAAFKRIEVSGKNVTASQENRRIEEEKYALGSTTLLNVLIANSEYTNAMTNVINAQYEYRKLKDQLTYLVGSLEVR
jgi:outer membrane protein